MSAYNEKLCDERHDHIRARLEELRKISWGLLIVTCIGVIGGLLLDKPVAKTMSEIFISMVR